MGCSYWPVFDLEVRTPRLTLRALDDERAIALVQLAARGIHDPDEMPFARPWSRAESPRLERQALQFYWRCRAEMTPTSWNINFAVEVDGTIVGTSGMMASEFPRMRQFETGSWLGREYQGQGIGKEMRMATLALGFEGFGADVATTGAWHDNVASLRVTRALGYRETGRRRALRDDTRPDELVGFEMSREHFVEHVPHDHVELIGVGPVREFLEIPA